MLALADGDRMIFISLRLKFLRHKFMARYASHRGEYALITNAAILEAASPPWKDELFRRIHRHGKSCVTRKGFSTILQLFYLLFPTPDSHVEAHNPVLVAESDNRDITGDVVHPLNDLLRSLRNISAIRERQNFLNLLFDGHCRGICDWRGRF